jgi:hypothetical protein
LGLLKVKPIKYIYKFLPSTFSLEMKLFLKSYKIIEMLKSFLIETITFEVIKL